MGITANANFISQTLCTNLAATTSGGYQIHGTMVPLDLDRSRPVYLDITLCTPNIVPHPNDAVVITLDFDLCDPLGNNQTINLFNIVATPSTFVAFQTLTVPIVDGTGVTIAAHTILPNSTFGCQVRRNGGDANDTYPFSIYLLNTVALRYNKLCSYGDCP